MSPSRGACGPFTLAVCSEMVFLDLSVAERVRRITELGFQVEIWDWTKHDIDELVALRDEGAVFSSMTGYVRGGLVEPMPPTSCSRQRRSRSPSPSGSASLG